MMYEVDETHDPELRCRVASAHDPGTDFPIQNLPFGMFSPGFKKHPRPGVAIGNRILDLMECAKRGLLDALPEDVREACTCESLNALMALGLERRSSLRRQISRCLRTGGPSRSVDQVERSLVPMDAGRMLLPARIGNYTDFYASIHHARNVGSMFRPENPLLPNYRHVPVGYHGRASSIVISGVPVCRPCGQTDGGDSLPVFGPSRMLDYELETGFFVGRGNDLGDPVEISHAESHLFGISLVNDWSARDIQKWEYQPLGPFLGKSFATTISPWVVTMESLAPYRVPAAVRPAGDPAPLPYLTDAHDIARGGIALQLEVYLSSGQMRMSSVAPVLVSRSRLDLLYWTPAQLLTHHTSNGCNLLPGDLLASGTVSGPDKNSRGCLLELTWRGTEPLELPGGEIRKFLEDGDEVIFRGRAGRIGLGECRAIIYSRSISA